MPTLRHVLVCLDGSPLSERGLPHAISLASCFGARVTLLCVLESRHDSAHTEPSDALDWEIGRAEACGHLEQLVQQQAGCGLRIDSEVFQGPAAEQIAVYARANDVDLTVLTTHGSAGVSEWTLASTARKVVESGVGAALIVPATLPPTEEVRYKRILVPLDASARAECVLPMTISIAEAQDSELIFAHVLPSPELTSSLDLLTPEDLELEERLRARNERVANRYLSQLRKRHGIVPARSRTVLSTEGEARQKLVDIARREHADLVVLSAHGQTGSCEWLYGSVTMHLMAHTPAPVLVVQDLPDERLNRIRAARTDRKAPVRPHGGSVSESR
ncbi:MAG: universal stress protein [Planctomycetota bacterium]